MYNSYRYVSQVVSTLNKIKIPIFILLNTLPNYALKNIRWGPVVRMSLGSSIYACLLSGNHFSTVRGQDVSNLFMILKRSPQKPIDGNFLNGRMEVK